MFRYLQNIGYELLEFLYYWQCKLFHPYNTLKIETLPPTWNDRDYVLLHACFQILVDFMEKEWEGIEQINWNSDPKHVFAKKELDELYTWWTEERPLRIDVTELVECPDDKNSPEYEKWKEACNTQTELDQDYFEEDQHNLYRLIEIRPFMWT